MGVTLYRWSVIYGLVDQISWLACRQRVLEMDFSRQSVRDRSV